MTRGRSDFMAAAFALPFVQQHDLNIGFPGILTQIVMPYHAIEIERRSRAHIGLQRGHFGQFSQRFGQLAGHIGRLQHCGALGQVDDHIEFGLVVERQHLHGDRLRIEHRTGEEK